MRWVFIAAAAAAASIHKASQPHIIHLMVDDYGWNNVRPYA
jgi:hypothetical protein